MGNARSSDWGSRRKQVYERDNHTCQNCNIRGGKRGNAELHAHHIVPLKDGGSNDMSNLVTLCRDCHEAIHSDKIAPTLNGSRPTSGMYIAAKFVVWSVYIAGERPAITMLGVLLITIIGAVAGAPLYFGGFFVFSAIFVGIMQHAKKEGQKPNFG